MLPVTPTLQTVRVILKAEESAINLRIEDNGIGFDPLAIKASASGGIIGMQERISLISGHFAGSK